jgi:hypothetical protein
LIRVTSVFSVRFSLYGEDLFGVDAAIYYISRL